MIVDAIRKIAYAVTPPFLVRKHIHARLLRKGRELVAADQQSGGIEDSLGLIWSSHDFKPIQILSEIRTLLDRVRERKPATIVEIGSAGGGTTFLFSRAAGPGTRIISVDLGFSDERMEAIEAFALPGQTIRCVRADSQCQETAERVRELLSGDDIDLLFIDGDHSYGGVSADFHFYSPLVASGGFIAFHDIVPDFHQRFGRNTVVDTGEVPRFWSELKSKSQDAVEEIIEHPDQDGYGLGIVKWAGRD